MKNKYPFQLIDLRHQVDHKIPKKNQLFEEFNTDPAKVNASVFVLLIGHRQTEMISHGKKSIEIKVIQMKNLYFRDFMKIYKLKKDIMNESELQRVYNYKIYHRDSLITENKAFVNLDNGSMGVTQLCAFYAKDHKSYYFDSFGGQPDTFLLNQLPKPTKYHHYKLQDINSTFSGSYCFYFFYLIEKKKNYDTILKLVFE